MICSTTTPLLLCSSYSAGVAETKTACGTISSNSRNFSGRLSSAEGSRKPYSTNVSLRDRLMALVDEDEEILRVVVEQAGGRLSRRAPGEVARVILDPVAESKLLDHLQVEQRALLE